ncbi:unnamed protein product [Phaeothamnion confervicola]
MKVLEERVAVLEFVLGGNKAVDDAVERCKHACSGLISARFKWVASSYYELSLAERSVLLGCTPGHLCKTLIMENFGCQNLDCADPLDSRFYLVVVQYEARIVTSKLEKAVYLLKPEGERPPRNKISLQAAPEEVGLPLSGFPHNGVSPFGAKAAIPVVLAAAVFDLAPRYIWMGAGHPDLKLRVSVADFVAALRPVAVADFTEPRVGVDVNS